MDFVYVVGSDLSSPEVEVLGEIVSHLCVAMSRKWKICTNVWKPRIGQESDDGL